MIEGLFLDIGGVLLTGGWDHALRKKTADLFQFDYTEMEKRHQLIFDTYETGKMSLDDYLKKVIFYQERPFTIQELKQFIFDSAQAYEDMIEYIKEIRERYHLKIGVVSNEGRELAIDRIHRFNLASFVDFFVVSSFVHFRKPDPDIYRLAVDIIQIPPSKIAYIDDRKLLVDVGKGLGLQSIHHQGLASTASALNLFLSRSESVSRI